MSAGPSKHEWTELRGALRSFIARRVASSDADDVLQDALLRIHRGVEAVKDDERLVPWLYRVARNAITDHHRRRGASRLELVSDLEPFQSDIVMDDRERHQLSACVVPFVDNLPEPNRSTLRLVELDGLRMGDVAKQLGVPISTIKARVQRGRAQLRTNLERCCRFERDARGTVAAFEPKMASNSLAPGTIAGPQLPTGCHCPARSLGSRDLVHES